MEKVNKRRSALKKLGIGIAGIFGFSSIKAGEKPKKKIVGVIVKSQQHPLFSGAVKHGNTLYIAGKGALFDGDIKAHTDHVLKEIQKALEKNGSSMEKVLKVNVYLADLADYKAMNEVYRGEMDLIHRLEQQSQHMVSSRNSLVEIDCIAALD